MLMEHIYRQVLPAQNAPVVSSNARCGGGTHGNRLCPHLRPALNTMPPLRVLSVLCEWIYGNMVWKARWFYTLWFYTRSVGGSSAPTSYGILLVVSTQNNHTPDDAAHKHSPSCCRTTTCQPSHLATSKSIASISQAKQHTHASSRQSRVVYAQPARAQLASSGPDIHVARP